MDPADSASITNKLDVEVTFDFSEKVKDECRSVCGLQQKMIHLLFSPVFGRDKLKKQKQDSLADNYLDPTETV